MFVQLRNDMNLIISYLFFTFVSNLCCLSTGPEFKLNSVRVQVFFCPQCQVQVKHDATKTDYQNPFSGSNLSGTIYRLVVISDRDEKQGWRSAFFVDKENLLVRSSPGSPLIGQPRPSDLSTLPQNNQLYYYIHFVIVRYLSHFNVVCIHKWMNF